ncbi:hypothetical protein A3C09_01465 [Candidatus Uhrbacteria bacterium RIFCSPHIGHO2_02_FULL_47_44]|uniref:DUF5640 domain-containing protein n=1 Tax=Candidatus Uhrbacteria bacterium RIFCSPLOWO2_02_FULL_48_18 TaxID=1802408 RepID=A0A1F7VAB2_9BACT|nr:MAG: hypothetical protein A2839_02345 [Candidatus Uhrbacteria bacterium RIFCSPHIGHO2_01_FULL_47_10]OGL69833.1 MAG: hypothetical protein A3C09_01465 [Candidatus Uhrbacteria bacterium RIFCSPHIGHO2_02_FULL_47_44]OGL77453.1 MAG: hypothetical protein A3E97_00525 [Candidatus Uhrbacteria bacterium RIFCSPHIGHO2_12_FULL_47_12]OGL81814.1 MAG: hypothetical protein A3B20_01830 [Candidatus Uhrbacteria bacterium RIFCSPLOWO2_01_FULL_47_17]OGL86977.1 MAG: hypothetical protein A3I41_03420 [Candidatus Uhrbact
MTKKQLSLLGSIVLAAALLGVGGFVLFQKTSSPAVQEMKDEFTGTWRADAVTKDGYAWFVEYSFKNGTYDMKTESAFKDNGTYQIIKRFEDNVSVQMQKTSIPYNKTYDIYISIIDEKTIMIDGMKLYKK